jgi:transposase-like protein
MNEECKAIQAKALEQLRSSQSLTGKDGAFAPLLKPFKEAAFSAEMAGYLVKIEQSKWIELNGKGIKTFKTHARDITIETLQFRHSTFSPYIV